MRQNPVFKFLKNHAFFLLGGACIIIAGVIFIAVRGAGAEVTRNGRVVYDAGNYTGDDAGGEEDSATGPAYIGIHITGAVNTPGFFEFPGGARVNDAVERAGGATAEADLGRVNLALFLRDEMKIIIPAEGEEIEYVFIFADGMSSATGEGTGAAPGITPCGLVNINTATSEELQTLPGIGRTIAQNIIDFREAHGGFSSVEELIHVPRIGEVTLGNLRERVTAG